MLLTAALTAALFMATPVARAQTTTSVSLSIQDIYSHGSNAFNGVPEMVTGVWNYLNISVTPALSGPLNLVAFYGSALPSNKSVLNYYEWSYSPLNGSWYDPVYGCYVNSSLSSVSGGEYSFAAGMFDKANAGEWNLYVMNGSSFVTAASFYVSEPSVGMTFSAPTFQLVVPPYTVTTVNSSLWSQYASTTNTGSIPETITFTFPSESFIDATENTVVLQPGAAINHNIVVSSGSWSPQLIPFTGTVTASFSGLIYVANSTQLTPDVQFPLSGTIEVGHSGYTISQIQNVTVQFRQSISAQYNRQTTETLFVSGSGLTDISVQAAGLKVLYISYADQNSTSSIAVNLVNGSEIQVLIGFVADQKKQSGTITLTFTVPGSPLSKTFTTQVAVTGVPASSTSPPHNTLTSANITAAAFAAAAVLATAAAMILISRQHGRRRPEKESSKKVQTGQNVNRNARMRKYKGPEEIKPRKGWNR